MFRRKPQDDHIYRVVTICLGAEKAEEFKKELEQKTGYEFNVESFNPADYDAVKEYLEKFAEWMESQFRKDDKKHSDPSDVMHIIWSYKIWEFVEFLKQHAEYGNITDFEKKRQETV